MIGLGLALLIRRPWSEAATHAWLALSLLFGLNDLELMSHGLTPRSGNVFGSGETSMEFALDGSGSMDLGLSAVLGAGLGILGRFRKIGCCVDGSLLIFCWLVTMLRLAL